MPALIDYSRPLKVNLTEWYDADKGVIYRGQTARSGEFHCVSLYKRRDIEVLGRPAGWIHLWLDEYGRYVNKEFSLIEDRSGNTPLIRNETDADRSAAAATTQRT